MSELALALLTIHGIAAGVVVTFFGYRLLRDSDAIGPRSLAAPLLLMLSGVAIVFTSLFLGLRPPDGLLKPNEPELAIAKDVARPAPEPAPKPDPAPRPEPAPDVQTDRPPTGLEKHMAAPSSVRRMKLAAADEVRVSGDREAVPENMLALVSWNIQTGGTSVSAPATRPPMVRDALKRMLDGTFQVIAAQEIPSQVSAQLLVGLLPTNRGPVNRYLRRS
jgi:hypothetical protein